MRRGGTLSLPINLSIEIFVFRPFGWIVLNVLDCVKIIFFATDYMVVETPLPQIDAGFVCSGELGGSRFDHSNDIGNIFVAIF